MRELKEIELGEAYKVFDDDKEFYLKSEADKVIAHNKYKRCLAMAWWCSAELGMLVSTWEFKIKHYKKWHRRWLQLAKKFKPNKEQ